MPGLGQKSRTPERPGPCSGAERLLEVVLDRIQRRLGAHAVFLGLRAAHADRADVLAAANELIELCRSTQSSYVRIAGDV